ncbi:MAG: BMP family ABC transporter substrate-binding protein [Mycoplasma sp.]|nr:BMP family ABC transporter substrate-binding protein [Candidatus Hennigella equi]
MKFKSFLAAHKTLVNDVVVSTCLIGASAGVVFGISAGMFKVEYMQLHGIEQRVAAMKNNNYLSEDIDSSWNMNQGKTADGKIIPGWDAPEWSDMKEVWSKQEVKDWFYATHGNDAVPLWDGIGDRKLQIDKVEGDPTYNAYEQRYKYASLVIDGAAHSTMDRSFNQSLYQGLVDFIHNEHCDHCDAETGKDPEKQFIAKSWKPSQDTTTDFINTYVTAIRENDVLGLAGFNHTTPLSTMMQHKEDGDVVDKFASNSDPEINKYCNSTAFILLDSNIANNQNIASVQFRADQPGFLAGLATCQYLMNNLDLYHDKFQDIAVAAFGGVAIPTVTIYIGGFQRGIELYNYCVISGSLDTAPKYYFASTTPIPSWEKTRLDTFNNLIKHSKYKADVEAIANDTSLSTEQKVEKFNTDCWQNIYDEFSIKMIKLGGFDTHFSGTFAAGDAIGITKQYLNRGASAIIAVAGPQSLDASQEIRNQNSKAIVIGVDSAMEDGDYQRYHHGCDESSKTQKVESDPYVDATIAPDNSCSPQANSIIKFSAVKDLRNVGNRITRLCAEGKNWDISAGDQNEIGKPDPRRAVCGPGFQTCGNILNGLISISWDGFYYMLQALSHVSFSFEQYDNLGLEQVWAIVAAKYVTAHAELDPEYAEGIVNINNIKTFNRTYKEDVGEHKKGDQTVYYLNYNSTTEILGDLFNSAKIAFADYMSLVKNEAGEFVPMTVPSTNLTILDWLANNMYMMS